MIMSLPSYNIQTKGRDIHSPLPYLIFKTSKQGEGVIIPLPSPSPLTFYSSPPSNFQTHQNSKHTISYFGQ
jgi:hypothetical protein